MGGCAQVCCYGPLCRGPSFCAILLVHSCTFASLNDMLYCLPGACSPTTVGEHGAATILCAPSEVLLAKSAPAWTTHELLWVAML